MGFGVGILRGFLLSLFLEGAVGGRFRAHHLTVGNVPVIVVNRPLSAFGKGEG